MRRTTCVNRRAIRRMGCGARRTPSVASAIKRVRPNSPRRSCALQSSGPRQVVEALPVPLQPSSARGAAMRAPNSLPGYLGGVVAATMGFVLAGIGCGKAQEHVSDDHIVCMSHLREVGRAMLLYAEANDGFVPPYVTSGYGAEGDELWLESRPKDWRDSLVAIGGMPIESFRCPSETADLIEKSNRVESPFEYTSYTTWGFWGAVGRDEAAIAALTGPGGSLRLNLSSVVLPTAGYAGDLSVEVGEGEDGVPVFGTGHGRFQSLVCFDGSVLFADIGYNPEGPPEWPGLASK